MSRLFMTAAASIFLLTTTQAQTSGVVISQVYGGGGNTGAIYTHDFIELFNGTASSVSLNGWSVQYASATGTTWSVTALTNTTLAPGQYYLVRLATGGAVGSALPSFDASGSTNMSATAGKVSLVNSTTALSGLCPTTGVIDLIGFGSTASCFEGASFAPAGSNSLALFRASSGCTDSNNNSTDFATATPAPRNTLTPLNPCSAPCTAPSFTTCPSPVSVSTGASSCNAVVSYTVAASGAGPISFSYSFTGATIASGSGNGSGSTFAVGVTSVTITASNSCGSATCSFTVTVTDNTPPAALCQNITVNLDPSGNATITPAQVNNGSTDNCGTVNLISVVPNTFNCSNLSVGAAATGLFFSEYVEGSSNNKYIEIFNGTGATVDLSNYQLRLYANGSATATTTNTLSGLLANGATVVYRNSAATIYAGPSTVISAVNWNGDDAIALFNVSTGLNEDIFGSIGFDPGTSWAQGGNTTVDRTLRRLSTVAQGVTTNPATSFPQLGTEWTQFLIDNVSGLGSHTFTPPPTPTPVTLTINDGNGNTSSCTAQVTILDNIAPVITTCASNQDVNLNATCQLVVPNLVAQTTATDNCAATVTQSPAAGTILASSHNQTHVVTITATDASGNSASCTVTLTGKDVTPPTAVCQNVTVNLGANGQGTITAAQVNNGSSDNCGTVNLVSVTPNTFNCLNLSVPVPPSVWINEIHYDNSGADAGEFIELAGTAGINLSDYALVRYNGSNPAAAVIYTSSAQTTVLTGTIPSQSNGYGTFAVFYAADGLQNGTADGVALVNTTTSTVVQLLSYEGVFTVAAGQGAASGMTSTDIGVAETGTLAGGSVRLSGTGNQYSNFAWQAEAAPASPGAVNAGQSFPSSANTVTLTVNDGNGNTSTCTANVTVLDQINPVAVCQNISVNLDANGNASITAMQVNNGSSDNCGIVSMTVSPSTFTCANVGPNTVTLTVTDASGNSHSCTATVTVVDNIAPTVSCQNATVYLDANGQASIAAAQINNGSSDVCGIASVSVSPSALTCADVSTGEANATGLFFSEYVEGSSFNKYIEIYNGTGAAVNLANYQLRLYSNGSPTVSTTSLLSGILANGQTVVYRNSGAVAYAGVSTAAAAVNWNGDDAIALYNTITGQNEDIFGVIGNDPGTAWTGTGGYSTADRTLRRKSNILSGVTVNPSSFATLNSEWDLFLNDDVSGLGAHTFNPGPVGTTVTLTVTDVSGNSSTCTSTVIVIDNVAPVALCQNITVQLNAAGVASITAAQIDNGSNDACGIESLSVSPSSFTCANVGPNTVTLTVIDNNGNVSTCTATVTVQDNVAPVALCQNITVDLDATGNASITASQIDNGSNDACGIQSMTVFPNTFTCANAGANTVTLTVTDNNGNVSTCTATVTVEDNILPTISCPAPVSVNNDPGSCGALVNYTVNFDDNCAGSTVQQTAGLTSGAIFPIGTTVNTYVVTDASGNTATCSFPVTVTDVELPYFTNVPSNFSACNPVTWTPPTPNDNCLGASVTSSHQPGDIFQSGTTTVTYTVTDASGLDASVTFDVTLLEPSVAATNITSDRDYDNICVGEAITLTVNGGFLGDGAEWVWYSGSCGGTPVASGVGSITVSPSTTTTYFVRAEGDCNNTACVSLTVVVSTGAPAAAPVYTYLPAYGAPGLTDSLVVAPVAGATYYRWFTNNGQINGVLFNNQLSPVQTAAPRVDVTFVLPQQNYQLRVIAGNACGRSGQRNATVRGTVAAPASLTGPTQVCPGQSHQYTVSAIAPVSGNTQVSYNWQLIPSNAGTISGTGLTRTITFAPGFNGAQLCVNGVSSFGLAGTPLCINIATGAPAPAAILGTNSVCEGASGIAYSATPVANAISYSWTSVPAGVIFSGNTENVTATFPAGAWSGTICVAAVTSTCGTSQNTCMNVSTITPGVLSTITGPVSGVCLESNVNYSTDAGATSYSWTLPSGATGSSTTSSINVNFGAGFTSGVISVTGQFACNTSSTTINVTGSPAIPSIASGGLSSICPGAAGTQYSVASTGATQFNWTAAGVATTSGCINPPLCSTYGVDQWGMTPALSVTAANSCGTSAPFVFPVGCRMTEAGVMSTAVYPNPTSGKITVEYTNETEGKMSLMVTDLSGRLMMQQELTTSAGLNQSEADLGHFESGVYLLQLRDDNGNIKMKRIVVE